MHYLHSKVAAACILKVIVADELFAIAPAGSTLISPVATATPLMNALLMVAGVLPELVTMTCKVSELYQSDECYVCD